MSVTHAVVEGNAMCPTPGNLRVTLRPEGVTCKRCQRMTAELESAALRAAADKRIEDQYATACDSMGVGHLWRDLSTTTPTDRLMRGVFGAVVLGLHEQKATA